MKAMFIGFAAAIVIAVGAAAVLDGAQRPSGDQHVSPSVRR